MSAKVAWKVAPETAALVVIDMQRTFLDNDAPIECGGGREIVPRINELASMCRRLKIPVIQIRTARRPDLSDVGLYPDLHPNSWPTLVNHELFTVEGRKGADFYPGLDVAEDDYIVTKIRYSAFISGSSNLELLLRGLGKDSFIACGVATAGCVWATVADGMMLGFRVFLVGDLTAAPADEQEHARVALDVMGKHYAKLMTFEEIMKELEQLVVKAGT